MNKNMGALLRLSLLTALVLGLAMVSQAQTDSTPKKEKHVITDDNLGETIANSSVNNASAPAAPDAKATSGDDTAGKSTDSTVDPAEDPANVSPEYRKLHQLGG